MTTNTIFKKKLDYWFADNYSLDNSSTTISRDNSTNIYNVGNSYGSSHTSHSSSSGDCGKLLILIMIPVILVCSLITIMKDRYIMFYLSGIDKLFKRNYKNGQNGQNTITTYRQWKKSYIKRTLHNFYAKLAMIGSIITLIISLYFGITILSFMCYTTGILSIMYLIWRHYSADTINEQIYYKQLRDTLIG